MSHDEIFLGNPKVKYQQIKIKINQRINFNKQTAGKDDFHFVSLIFMLFLLLVCYSCRFLLLPLQW